MNELHVQFLFRRSYLHILTAKEQNLPGCGGRPDPKFLAPTRKINILVTACLVSSPSEESN